MKVPQFVEKQYKARIFHNFYTCILLKLEQSIMHETLFLNIALKRKKSDKPNDIKLIV